MDCSFFKQIQPTIIFISAIRMHHRHGFINKHRAVVYCHINFQCIVAAVIVIAIIGVIAIDAASAQTKSMDRIIIDGIIE